MEMERIAKDILYTPNHYQFLKVVLKFIWIFIELVAIKFI